MPRQEEEPDWESESGEDDDDDEYTEDDDDEEESEEDEDDEETSEGDEETDDDDDEEEDDDDEDDEEETEDDSEEEVSSEEEESDEDDDEDSDEEDDFEDEPDAEKGLASRDGEDGFDDEDDDEDKSSPDRDRLYLILGVACCCLVIIGLAVGLGVGLSGDDDPAPTAAPTIRAPTGAPTIVPLPTPAPIDPTESPTIETAPGEIALTSSGDTTIYLEGPQQGQTHGDVATMLVRASDSEPNSYALVQFDVDLAMYPWFQPGGMAPEGSESTMCLKQNVGEDAATTPDRELKACLLFEPGVNIEELTGENPYTIDDCVNEEVVTFSLTATQREICIDAASLVFQSLTVPVRRLRKLQSTVPYLFMILNEIEDAFPGSEFFTSSAENATLYPTLTLFQPYNGTDMPLSEAPSASVQPSVSSSPSLAPSISIQPSVSYVPSQPPSLSLAPSLSSVPSGLPSGDASGLNPVCSACGEGQTVSLENLDAEVTLPGSDTPTTCFEVSTLCATGGCDADACTAIPAAISEACGCAAANPPCSFCGEGEEVTDPDGEVTIPQGVLPGLPATLSCALGETLCASGGCTPEVCAATPAFVSQDCGCAPVG
mmetsp:Transcript_27051/g.64629  ORF Transcript_27051/g.64629 Transcript_27051/m.64629 type:complete len:601 (+) Transcript_27051:647-2449(+)|eukprot:CAMPEP_0113463236 /NCGR_PEP_ID=MMETSP0014_2-20120614/12535_1 /TAXON_ID=2857 /ORGANISM="Nitzschia sp." /LENGTH=600 /DNA_ID=CAMNT_0000355187 /DNA_START=538 /DNA_END=2340 /DNA_ORIENTATION=- /assembly_acc=CAM_ASM_000159